jgi:hypothetical protein
VGASHQTGWTGVITRIMQVFAVLTPERILEGGKKSVHQRQATAATAPQPVGH